MEVFIWFHKIVDFLIVSASALSFVEGLYMLS